MMEETEIQLVLAADSKFVMPLAVTVRSVLDNLSAGRRLALTILDGGLDPADKDRLSKSWTSSKLTGLEWRTLDRSVLSALKISGHVNEMAYYRMLVPEALPESVKRVIYLDCDLLVRRDLSEIWDQDSSGSACLAAQDCAAPYLDSATALTSFRSCAAYLVARRPVPNAQALGLDGSLPYFNSGVMLIDVDCWRRENVTRRLIECLRANHQHIRWWDQYALNVVLAGRWKPLDVRWNQGSHLYRFPNWRCSPFDETTFERLRSDPFIVHFTSVVKPWHAECRHPYREDWFQCLDRTPWKGWRPPTGGLQKVSRSIYWEIREQVRLGIRRTQMLLGGGRLK